MGRITPRTAALRIGLPLLAFSIASAVLLAGIASATGGPKPYKAVIAPASVGGGSSSTYTYTITNLTNQKLGSANVSIPSGWSVTSIVSTVASAGKVWTSTLGAGVIQLRNNGPASTQRLAQNQSVTVTFQATAPCVAPANDDWTPVVKQANNFNGSGNDFVLNAAQSDLDVSLTGGSGSVASFAFDPIPDADPLEAGIQVQAGTPFAVTVRAKDGCGNISSFSGSGTLSGLGTAPNGTPPSYGALTFVGGVATANVTATRAAASAQLTVTSGSLTATSAAFEVEAGPPSSIAFIQEPTTTQFGEAITPAPAVSVTDQFGNPVENGTSVTVALDANSFGGVLDGVATRSTTAGSASFPGLDIDEVGIDYTLTATAGAASATSDPFDIVTVQVDCSNHPNEPCVGSTGADTNPGQPTNAQVFAPAGGNPGTLDITLFDVTPGQCADGTGMAVVVNPPSGHGNDNPIRVTVEYDKSVAKGGVAHFEFCIEKLVAGETVVIDPVPNCKDTAGTPDPFPCIDERHRSNAGDLIVVFLITDDPILGKK
jgi:hypothetical protein